jgi:hypothetical protein
MRAPSSLARGRSAILAGFGVNGWLGRPPLYLREIAREAGLEIDGMRWGMAAPGLYLSNKVLLLLFDRSNEGPAYVVKVARDPSINPRLENEWRALLRLRELGFAKDGSVPEPAFYGTSGRLAVLGLGGIAGRRFTQADPAGPSVVGAVEWITELGATTVDPTGAAGPVVARELRRLLAHLVDLYAIDADHRSILAEQIDVIEGAQFLPLVFQHGDPGAWNLLVRPSGEASFLDWEAAEPNGMPLWDLFHLMRSFGVMAARADGARDALEGFGTQLLQDTPLSLMLRESTAVYCTRVGVAPDLVEPLFHMSWMHRALKEATRLVPGRLERGHYVNLMRRCLDERERGPLRELFNIRSPVEG